MWINFTIIFLLILYNSLFTFLIFYKKWYTIYTFMCDFTCNNKLIVLYINKSWYIRENCGFSMVHVLRKVSTGQGWIAKGGPRPFIIPIIVLLTSLSTPSGLEHTYNIQSPFTLDNAALVSLSKYSQEHR